MIICCIFSKLDCDLIYHRGIRVLVESGEMLHMWDYDHNIVVVISLGSLCGALFFIHPLLCVVLLGHDLSTSALARCFLRVGHYN